MALNNNNIIIECNNNVNNNVNNTEEISPAKPKRERKEKKDKEKIKTISRWCNQLKNHGFEMGGNLEGNEDYENAREKIRTVRLHTRKMKYIFILLHQ